MIRSHHDLPEAVFVGFFPKMTMQAPPELASAGVSEVASVSSCMSRPPEHWIDAWKHNELGFYDSEEAANSVSGTDSASAYDLYAYELTLSNMRSLRFRERCRRTTSFSATTL